MSLCRDPRQVLPGCHKDYPWGKLTATNIVEKPWFGKLSTDKWWLFHIVKVYSRVNISNMGYSIYKMAMDQPHLAGVDRILTPFNQPALLSRAMSAIGGSPRNPDFEVEVGVDPPNTHYINVICSKK